MTKDQKFKSKFQITETGICASYFNDILVSEPERIRNPERYSGGEKELRENLVNALGRIKTYTEYCKGVVARYEVSLDDFICAENADRVRELDEIAVSMKNLGGSPEKIDLKELVRLMHDGALLIYGKSRKEAINKRFWI